MLEKKNETKKNTNNKGNRYENELSEKKMIRFIKIKHIKIRKKKYLTSNSTKKNKKYEKKTHSQSPQIQKLSDCYNYFYIYASTVKRRNEYIQTREEERRKEITKNKKIKNIKEDLLCLDTSGWSLHKNVEISPSYLLDIAQFDVYILSYVNPPNLTPSKI